MPFSSTLDHPGPTFSHDENLQKPNNLSTFIGKLSRSCTVEYLHHINNVKLEKKYNHHDSHSSNLYISFSPNILWLVRIACIYIPHAFIGDPLRFLSSRLRGSATTLVLGGFRIFSRLNFKGCRLQIVRLIPSLTPSTFWSKGRNEIEFEADNDETAPATSDRRIS